MIDFIVKNWDKIIIVSVAVAGFIASFVLAQKKKGKSDIIGSIKEALLENIPFWATISEGLSSGQAKKENVLSLGIALVSKMLGRNPTADENDYYLAFISEQLEKVLATPQKKMIKAETQPSKYRIGG